MVPRRTRFWRTTGGAAELPSGIPSFLEACGKLAAEAAARGDLTRARDLVEKSIRVAALQQDHAGARRGT